MHMSRSIAGLLGVAGIGFVAGILVSGDGPVAKAAQEKDYEISPEQQAWIEAGQPGKHHRSLEAMIGEWTGEFKIYMEPGAPPMTSKGTVKREWILGGRYVQETIEATSDMGTFTGLGFIGYDNVDGVYETAWMDDHSTGIYTESGIYDPATKTMVMRGAHRNPVNGQLIMTRGTLNLSNPDRHVYAGYATGPDGREYLHFEGVTQRK